MSVLVETSQGRMLYCKGALETLLSVCEHVALDSGTVPLDAAVKTRLLAAQDTMAGLACACWRLPMARLTMACPPRNAA